jgi:hypothetical protein
MQKTEASRRFRGSRQSESALEHVPKKLIDLFGRNMLQLFEFEQLLFDQMDSFDRDALLQRCRTLAPRDRPDGSRSSAQREETARKKKAT